MKKPSRQSETQRNPSLLWFFEGEDQEAREKFVAELHNNSNNNILKKLRGIVLRRLSNLEGSERNEDYMSPSWPSLQAHRNGRKQEMYFLFSLLGFLVEDEHVTQYKKEKLKDDRD